MDKVSMFNSKQVKRLSDFADAQSSGEGDYLSYEQNNQRNDHLENIGTIADLLKPVSKFAEIIIKDAEGQFIGDVLDKSSKALKQFTDGVEKNVNDHHSTIDSALHKRVDDLVNYIQQVKKELDNQKNLSQGENEAFRKGIDATLTNLQGEFLNLTQELEGKIKDLTEAFNAIPTPKDGDPGKDAKVTNEMIVSALKKAPKSILKTEHIEGLDKILKTNSQGTQGRGYIYNTADMLKGGTNITITPNADGTFTINSSAGATTTYTETPSGAINSVNTTYTVLHPINTVFSFAINGQFLHPGTDYTKSGSTITFLTPLDSSLSGTPFTITYT